MRIIERFKAWRERRYWQARHLEFVANMMRTDHRWLAGNQVADALTTRYVRAMGSDWYCLEHEPVERFRETLRKLSNLTDEQKLRNVRNALYTEQLRGSLQTILDLCAIGDVDENTEVHGWGDAIKRARALIEADAAITDGVVPCEGGKQG